MTTVTVDTTLIERPSVFGNTTRYNVAEIVVPNIANAAGGGAGTPVTTSIVFSGDLPVGAYTVTITPDQACAASYANKTQDGFDVVLTPASGVTLSVGTFDLIVTWSNGPVVGV